MAEALLEQPETKAPESRLRLVRSDLAVEDGLTAYAHANEKGVAFHPMDTAGFTVAVDGQNTIKWANPPDHILKALGNSDNVSDALWRDENIAKAYEAGPGIENNRDYRNSIIKFGNNFKDAAYHNPGFIAATQEEKSFDRQLLLTALPDEYINRKITMRFGGRERQEDFQAASQLASVGSPTADGVGKLHRILFGSPRDPNPLVDPSDKALVAEANAVYRACSSAFDTSEMTGDFTTATAHSKEALAAVKHFSEKDAFKGNQAFHKTVTDIKTNLAALLAKEEYLAGAGYAQKLDKATKDLDAALPELKKLTGNKEAGEDAYHQLAQGDLKKATEALQQATDGLQNNPQAGQIRANLQVIQHTIETVLNDPNYPKSEPKQEEQPQLPPPAPPPKARVR